MRYGLYYFAKFLPGHKNLSQRRKGAGFSCDVPKGTRVLSEHGKKWPYFFNIAIS